MTDDTAAQRRAAEHRAAVRRFARDNHPDRGGDPAVFAAGLAALRGEDPRDDRPRFHRRRGPLTRLADRVRRLAAPPPPPRVR